MEKLKVNGIEIKKVIGLTTDENAVGDILHLSSNKFGYIGEYADEKWFAPFNSPEIGGFDTTRTVRVPSQEKWNEIDKRLANSISTALNKTSSLIKKVNESQKQLGNRIKKFQ